MRLSQVVMITTILASVVMMPVAAQSAGYAGDTITGSLSLGPNGIDGGNAWQDIFGPINSIVDPGTFYYSGSYYFKNIGQPNFYVTDTVTAAFTATTLTITNVAHVTAVGIGASGWKMSFTDGNVASGKLSLVSDTFAPDITYSLTGNTITVYWIGELGSAGPYSAEFNIVPSVPTSTLSATVLVFGSQVVGLTSATQSVTVTNGGTGAVNINGISITGTNSADYAETNACGS